MHPHRFVIALFVFASACAQETIAHQQVELDANTILVHLGRQGIEATKLKDESARDLLFLVTVPKSQSMQALEILHRYNLPKAPAPDSEAMFKDGGMIPTPEQQRAKREIGIRGDIINSLRAYANVVDVKAVVTLPEDSPLRDVNEAKPKPKVAVIVTYLEDGEGRPPLTVEDVQRFAQAAVPEIKSTEVGVNLTPALTLNGSKGSTGIAMPDPMKGCMEKEVVIGIEVCAGSKKRVTQMLLGGIVIAGFLAALVIFAVLRAMRYRKDLTRLTAQFQNVKGK